MPRRFFCPCAAALVPACGQPAAFVSGLVWPALPLPAVRPPCACVCGAFATAVWPVWLAAPGCAGRCRRPAAVREASRSHVCLLRLFFARIPRRRFPACVFDCRFCADFCTRCLFVRFVLCARAFLFYFSPFSASLLPLKNFFICRSGRDGPLLSSQKKVDKDSRGAAPLRTPFLRPAASLPFFRAAGRLSGPSAANRRLTGKRLKSQGAELSFSSVSVRRGTSAP